MSVLPCSVAQRFISSYYEPFGFNLAQILPTGPYFQL